MLKFSFHLGPSLASLTRIQANDYSIFWCITVPLYKPHPQLSTVSGGNDKENTAGWGDSTGRFGKLIG